MGIRRSTLYEWEKKHENIADALSRGRDEADTIVENALFRKTQGYNTTVKKLFKIKRVEYDKQTGKKIRETEELVEGYDEIHVPADEKAQEFWLWNRRPDKWKRNRTEDKQAETAGGGVIEIPEVKHE